MYRHTDSWQRWMKGSIPWASISALEWMPSSLQTSTSTGRPCVSQPAFRSQYSPRIVR
jgi:hypothetical protein